MDKINQAILACLKANSRRSWQEIGKCLDPSDHKLYKFGKLYRARQVLRSLMTDRNTIDEHS